jgi:CheY-like chemotaxis protein
MVLAPDGGQPTERFLQPFRRLTVQKHILVVEDDDNLRVLMEELLGDQGYSVAVSPTGTNALQRMHELLPDLVLLDLMLPDMNGWTFLRVREGDAALARVPVLVLSASGPAGLKRAQDLGAPVFLPKPFDVQDLLGEIERLLSGPARQCAWCGQVASSDGRFRLHSGRTLAWATHGVCPACKRRQLERLRDQGLGSARAESGS